MATESQGPTVTAVAIAFTVITVVAVSLRVWARIFLVKSFGTDDALICIAATLATAFTVVSILAVGRGLGDHIEEVMARGTANFMAYMQLVWLSSIFYNATLGFIKISVLALYMRLGDRMLRRLAMIMIGVITCQAGGNVFACIFQCSPIAAAYDLSIPAESKRCININAFYLANAAVNIFTDLLTYTLPIKLIINLQVSKQQKIGLFVILCLGLFACISSIIRITFIPQMLVNPDATWVISDAMYWSVIEINIGILAASIPSYKTIAKRYAPRLLGTSSNGGSRSHKKSSGGSGLYKLSGFQKISNNKSQTRSGGGGTARNTHHDSTIMDLRNLDTDSADGQHRREGSSGGGGVDGGGPGKRMNPHVNTRIEPTSKLDLDNSSEEALFAPKGKISVKTQITTQYEG
ncbi:uncharacterized protein B0I36DRAFT_323839 [Microdochium trichocladiopsis]|uniref:Rhodopsin domain-containing protein n=1 Tax=Microdochium trichocladiopsis TaxID=1682393 RepID=A0A9P9BNM3_9PEZI|nr:uncharacterized protein B0I36DRAFT_323839 [Microdochium trichocladiopsis]KAH7031396.1 hypothetical protein B0I36DRAFT_323839 [Microdochium trichocladiopsis]